ncbi:MAG: diheme cytochrome c [Pseudomonadota bacterium]
MGKIWRILLLLSVVTASGALLADDDEDEHEGRRGGHRSSDLPVLTHAAWETECSGCHMAYHPGLLPERSWRKLMDGLDKHFGENASLDDSVREDITRFLVANSADHSSARRSQKFAASIPANSTPLRISETRYFRAKHDEVKASVWKREKIGSPANCGACHQGAKEGDFSEDRVSIPR